jgi:hypothetical protein
VQFNSQEPIEFDRALIASTPLTPIIILTPERNNEDAIANLSKFVHEQGKSDKFIPISLGDDAEKLNQPTSTVLLSQALTQGNWVFVNHIYRNPSWLVNVEHALESASAHALTVATAAAATMSTSILPSKPVGSNYPGHSLNSDFRLWLHCVETLDSHVPVCSILTTPFKLMCKSQNSKQKKLLPRLLYVFRSQYSRRELNWQSSNQIPSKLSYHRFTVAWTRDYLGPPTKKRHFFLDD